MTTAQDGGKVVSLTHWPPLPPGNILCGVGDPLLLHIMVENVAVPNIYFWNFVKYKWERWTNVVLCCRQSVVMCTTVLQYKKIEESHVEKFKLRGQIR
jgi:hypothetical protein